VNVRRKLDNATIDGVKQVMAKSPMARSAQIAELKRDTTRIPRRATMTLSGTVDKIIPSSDPNRADKANVRVDEADKLYRDLRIDNILLDEHGDDVSLKKGAHVEVTITDDSMRRRSSTKTVKGS